MKRPYYVKKGTSEAEDSQEIVYFIKGSTGKKEIKMEVPWLKYMSIYIYKYVISRKIFKI